MLAKPDRNPPVLEHQIHCTTQSAEMQTHMPSRELLPRRSRSCEMFPRRTLTSSGLEEYPDRPCAEQMFRLEAAVALVLGPPE